MSKSQKMKPCHRLEETKEMCQGEAKWDPGSDPAKGKGREWTNW